MRTRFLATDYFSPSPAASSSEQSLALAFLRFPYLPVPSLPPDPHLPLSLPFPAVADLPAASTDGDGLDSLPISSALSEFLAAVIPQPLPVPTFPAADEGLDDFLYDRGAYSKGFSSRDSVAFKIPAGLDEINREKDGNGEGSRSDGSGTSTVAKRWEPLKELTFEVAEVDLPQVLQGDVGSFGGNDSGDGVTLSFRVPDVKVHLDILDIDTDITIKYPTELADKIYQVEKIPVKYDNDKDHSSTNDSDCEAIAALDLDHGIIIPQLEVSRNSWELDDFPPKAEISNTFHDLVKRLGEAQVQDSAFNSTEFLRPTDLDMLALVCKDIPCADYQADKPTTVKAAVEMDLLRINDNILIERNSSLYPLNPDGTCSDRSCAILLQEPEIIDFPPDDVFKMHIQSGTAELSISDDIFKNDFDPAKRFYESMVSSELALVDDTFKLLPTPILTDDISLRSVVLPIEEVLCSLKPLPLSAADGIYLDWHLLLEGPCNREICSTYAGMVEEVKTCHLSSELQGSCPTSALAIEFLEDFPRSTKLQDEDKQNDIYVPVRLPDDRPAILEATQNYRPECGHSHMDRLSSVKASSLFKSMSQSSELDFYLKVRSGTKQGTNNDDISTSDIPPLKEKSVSCSPKLNVAKLIEIHPVSLSDSIRGLIKHIHRSYTSALQESEYLRHSFSDGHGLSISKQKLLELITGEGSDGFYSHCKSEDKMELIVLYALKQAAYYLCFFGILAAHLYISNLTGSFENIPERLRNIHSLIGEARRKAEKQLSESHPSLVYIETILRSNTQTSQKVLIVADRAFWLPLGRKLTSMKMTFSETGGDSSAAYLNLANRTDSATWVLEELLKSDCILLDNKNIPASFPFNEFHIILEYGGPNKSCTILSTAPILDGLPRLHFLYVKVDVEDLPVELVEDDHTDQDLKSTLDTVLHTLQKDLQEKMNKMRLVDSLNFVPATNQPQGLQEKLRKHLAADSTANLPSDSQLHKVVNVDNKNVVDTHYFMPVAEDLPVHETLSKRTTRDAQHFVPAVEKSSSTSSVSANVMKAQQDNLSATGLPSSVKIDSITSGRLSAPAVAIVVNTGTHGKNMLFSRRSSYQQILALEKGGIQVVERDVDLPVDLILSAAVCLVWCETGMFGSNEFTSSTERSGLTDFVETIATNILMSLSFSFSGCIMVFEGEARFLSAVMESSDSLYAAASSLCMNLHLFFSHTPMLTDKIILSCIRNVTRLNKTPYPDIPESESLAESFLTKFPSINPLSAHIILSSEGSLVEFLSWSHERRSQAIEKYMLSPQSISLFTALCKFGEFGESRSVMTECSSVDSGISSALLHSPRKRKKQASQAFAGPSVDPSCADPRNQLPGDYAEHDNVFSPPKLRKFSDMDDIMPGLPEVFMFDQSLNVGSEGVSCRSRKCDMDAIIGNQVMDGDFSNGLTPNMRTHNGRSSSMVDMCNFSWQPKLGGNQPTKTSSSSIRPSFSRIHSHPVFPSALEINDDPVDWDVSGGTHHTWKGHVQADTATTSRGNDVGRRYHEPIDEIVQNPAGSLAFLKQDFGCHATSQGSGWEIDYLRQMNEKRRARQERSRCNASAMMSSSRMRDGSSNILTPPPIESFRYGDRDTHSRDRSPSTGAHRYGKAREGSKAQSQRGRKNFKVQPNTSHGNRVGPSIDSSWTPIDKRARQKLSFVTHGNEKQSKLVWSNKYSPGVGCGFRKRYREDGT